MTDTEIQQFQTDKQRKLNQADHGETRGKGENTDVSAHPNDFRRFQTDFWHFSWKNAVDLYMFPHSCQLIQTQVYKLRKKQQPNATGFQPSKVVFSLIGRFLG